MDWRDRIGSDPEVQGGALCIRGTRIQVWVVLDDLADGATAPEILASYPSLRIEDIRAAELYAKDIVRDPSVR